MNVSGPVRAFSPASGRSKERDERHWARPHVFTRGREHQGAAIHSIVEGVGPRSCRTVPRYIVGVAITIDGAGRELDQLNQRSPGVYGGASERRSGARAVAVRPDDR